MLGGYSQSGWKVGCQPAGWKGAPLLCPNIPGKPEDEGWKLWVANGPTPGPIGKSKEVGFAAEFHRATVAGNGLTMYLQGPLEEGKVGIFRSKRVKVGEPWSKPEPVTGLNHPESKKGDMQPALNADATRLYFVSDRPGGKGGLDIWTVPTILLK